MLMVANSRYYPNRTFHRKSYTRLTFDSALNSFDTATGLRINQFPEFYLMAIYRSFTSIRPIRHYVERGNP